MNFVERIIAGYKARMIATFYYSTLPFAAIPAFFNKVTEPANSENDDEHINKFLAGFLPVIAILGDAFLIVIGLVSLALALVAAAVQTLFLPVQLLVAGIEDSYSIDAEEEYTPDEVNTDTPQPGEDVTVTEENNFKNDDPQEDLGEEHEDEEQYQEEGQYKPEETGEYHTGFSAASGAFFEKKTEEKKPFHIDPVLAEEFLRKYGQ